MTAGATLNPATPDRGAARGRARGRRAALHVGRSRLGRPEVHRGVDRAPRASCGRCCGRAWGSRSTAASRPATIARCHAAGANLMVAGSAIYDQPSPGRGLAGADRARRGRVNERDAELLDRALDLAERGRRSASPNPLVGCVIARDGRVLGEGWHVRPRRAARRAQRAGRLHASRSSGATAYVSLEPCSHHGRQPPCADALIAAGIARVVCAIGDPEPGGRRARPRRACAPPASRSSSPAGAHRGAGAPPERRLPHARRARPPVRAAQAGRDPRRPHRHEHAARAAGSPRPRAARWCTTGGPSSTPSRSAAARRWPTTPSSCRAMLEPPAERLPLRVVFDRRGRLDAGSQARADRARARPCVRVAPAGAPPPPAGVEALDGGLARRGARGCSARAR